MRVYTAASGQDLRRRLAAGSVDLIILDMRLGHEDGLALMRDLRVQSQIPVVVVSGERRDEVDRILGLELGADDYILKPFSMRELLARIRAVLRRTDQRSAAPATVDRSSRYRFAGVAA